MFTPTQQRKIAQILKRAKEAQLLGRQDIPEKTKTLEFLKYEFIQTFRNENSNFDEMKFHRACDVLKIGE